MYSGVPVNATDNLNFIVFLLTFRPVTVDVYMKKVCTGSIIREDLILAAAHCIIDSRDDVKTFDPSSIPISVQVGYETDGQIKYLSIATPEIFVHPKYIYKVKYDLAIIKVHQSLLKDDRTVAQLPQYKLGIESHCTMAGFGEKNSIDKLKSLELTKINVNSTLFTLCPYQFIFKIMRTNVLCVVLSEKGPCLGDSGGPLFCDGKMYGVLSRGVVDNVCSGGAGLIVYEDVFENLEWIRIYMTSQITIDDNVASRQYQFTSVWVLYVILVSIVN